MNHSGVAVEEIVDLILLWLSATTDVANELLNAFVFASATKF